MLHKRDDANRRARKVDPSKSGMRTGNPQLETHERGAVRSSPRRPGSNTRVKPGEKRGA